MSTPKQNGNDDTQADPLQDPAGSTPLAPNESLLAELRARTAALADKVQGGRSAPRHHTLIIEPDANPDNDTEVVEILKQTIDSHPHPISHHTERKTSTNPAADLIRDKLNRLYKKEPSADEEIEEVQEVGLHRSRHQQFMFELTTSGKSLADIQTEWHRYYISLSDDEKHQVWREFYETQNRSSKFAQAQTEAIPAPKNEILAEEKPDHLKPHKPQPHAPFDPRTVHEIKSQLYDKITANGRLSIGQQAKSLAFGLGLAATVGLIITFTFFNEVFIAPFISPSRSVSATPIIGTDGGEVGPEPKIIIPKINLEVPVVFDMQTVVEEDVQAALEQGVVHYASTPNPGETGNSAIVGHSSNNILNKGKYKFAFVLLKRLENDDVFFVQKGGVRYTYKVYKKEIVGPDNIGVLDTQDKPNTMTLITCDPPGTSVNRLIIVGEQIAPDPSGNKPSTAVTPTETEPLEELPSNAPSLWSRIWPF